MAERLKFRSVRCPKCGTLLKELPHYSVYKCGGCDAVLRAKPKARKSDSGEERVEKLEIGLMTASESDGDMHAKRKVRFLNERTDNKGPEEEIAYAEKYRQLHIGDNTNRGKSWGRQLTKQSDMFHPSRTRDGPITTNDRIHFSTFVTPDEGPSNYGYGNGRPGNAFSQLDGPDSLAHLEQQPAELFRRLNDLKEHLARSCTVAEDQRWRTSFPAKVPPETYPAHVGHDFQLLPPDKPPYTKQYGQRPALCTENCGIDDHNLFFPPKYSPAQIGMLRPRLQQQAHLDFYDEHHASIPREQLYHHPACLSFYRNNENQPDYSMRKFSKVPRDSTFKHHIGPHACSPHSNPPSLQSKDQQLHSGWPSDIGSDATGFGQSCTRRALVHLRNAQYCRSIAGGSPFIACHGCFELLKLPIKLKVRQTFRQKLKCGACSTVLSLEINKSRLIVSLPPRSKEISTETDDSSCVVSNEWPLKTDGCLYAVVTNVPSENACHDNDFASLKSKEKVISEQRQSFSESEKGQRCASFSTSRGKGRIDDAIVRENISSSVELADENDVSLTFQSSNFPEHSSDFLDGMVNKYGEGNRSRRVDWDMVPRDNITCRQNYVEDTSMATEIEVQFDECLNSSVYQDSQAVKKDDVSRVGALRESFFMGFIKRSLREFSSSKQRMEDEKPNVFVNGQPITGRLRKMAESKAGPIHPGNYWYDFRAGFWGVIGYCCFGIIPPQIEEFNYPMPENCSDGNTCIFVNGRELNERDLELLAVRGLPKTRDKSYIIEISGRVLDEDTGKELYNLGKLAPTVQKQKRGFGMKVPREIM
ncbi:hypothetical protein K2173_022577 [Erythroxylum novogranatense]|uniref:Zinc-ribbon domain-containing protein n=1 Tax=Erythroxylum novogranatense TaxID=1862640 RepID=A0AAV8TND7_9ROSI|nr:hypothetical protein K2173_022577 [Erythroxylum novogranatense]